MTHQLPHNARVIWVQALEYLIGPQPAESSLHVTRASGRMAAAHADALKKTETSVVQYPGRLEEQCLSVRDELFQTAKDDPWKVALSDSDSEGTAGA